MICGKMDGLLSALARSYQCLYPRYADDITFSTYRSKFQEALAYYNENSGILDIGNEMEDLIKANGFRVNKRKVRLQTGARRQQGTGLTVNKNVNVRRKYIDQIRVMLYAWENMELQRPRASSLKIMIEKVGSSTKGIFHFHILSRER